MLKVMFVAAVLTLVLAGTAAAAAPWKAGGKHFVTERYLEAQLEKKYDFANCFGISHYGTRGFRTGEYSWSKAYTRFQCSYDSGTTSCYRAEVSVENAARRGWWIMRVVRNASCY